jgi:hypothetical protein
MKLKSRTLEKKLTVRIRPQFFEKRHLKSLG